MLRELILAAMVAGFAAPGRAAVTDSTGGVEMPRRPRPTASAPT